MRISDHAIKRVLEQTYPGKIKEAELMIKDVIKYGNRVYPTNMAIRLMNNNYEEAEYYLRKDMVVVIYDEVVKTVIDFQRNPGHWKKEK